MILALLYLFGSLVVVGLYSVLLLGLFAGRAFENGKAEGIRLERATHTAGAHELLGDLR